MKRVLIVEDDPGVQDVLQIILSRAGYDTTVLPNGNVILDGDYQQPDIFILDKQLSGVDGLDICRFLKKQSATSAIPVIIISATPDVAKLAKAACADAFLGKPFDNITLVELVASYFA